MRRKARRQFQEPPRALGLPPEARADWMYPHTQGWGRNLKNSFLAGIFLQSRGNNTKEKEMKGGGRLHRLTGTEGTKLLVRRDNMKEEEKVLEF